LRKDQFQNKRVGYTYSDTIEITTSTDYTGLTIEDLKNNPNDATSFKNALIESITENPPARWPAGLNMNDVVI